MHDSSVDTYDVAIVGGGLIGLSAALTLARSVAAATNTAGANARIALISPISTLVDGRTTALLGKSVEHFEKLDLWQDCLAYSAPLVTMRILDGTQRLWRAPPVEFKASELGLDAFGYNIANTNLAEVLTSHIDREKCITKIDTRIESAEIYEDHIALNTHNNRSVDAKLVIAADGRNSGMRNIAGISVKQWQYPQAAIAVNLKHSQPHHHTSTEFHTESGPFTLVPLPSTTGQYQSGLVWVMAPEEAERTLRNEPGQLERLIEDKMQSMLGKIVLASEPQNFPLTGMIAHKFGADRVALVGDAAHTLPPIGAQGFNLGLRDVIEICALASATMTGGGDPGSPAILARYNRNRRIDTSTRTGAVDLLNRSLLTSFLPVQAMRGLGLFALANVAPIRKFLMKQGLAVSAGQPRQN